MPLFGSGSLTRVRIPVVGDLEREWAETVAGALETHYAVTPDLGPRAPIHEPMPPGGTLHEESYDESRDQYELEPLLQSCRAVVETEPDTDCAVGVTGLSTYSGARNYVFGGSFPSHDAALVSIARFGTGTTDDDGPTVTDDAAVARARKETIKLFGYLHGAEQCSTRGCVMGSAPALLELDEQDEYICDACRGDIGSSILR